MFPDDEVKLSGVATSEVLTTMSTSTCRQPVTMMMVYVIVVAAAQGNVVLAL